MSKISNMLHAILGKKPDAADQLRYDMDASIALPEVELDGPAKLLLTGDAKAIFREFEATLRRIPSFDEEDEWIRRELEVAELLIDVLVWFRDQRFSAPTLFLYVQFCSGFKGPAGWLLFLDRTRNDQGLPADLRQRVVDCIESFPPHSEMPTSLACVGLQFRVWLGKCLGLIGPKADTEEGDSFVWQDPAAVALKTLQRLVDACDLLADVPEGIEAELDEAHAFLARVAAEERAGQTSTLEMDVEKAVSGVVFALARSGPLLQQGRSLGLRVGLSPKFKELISTKFPNAAPLVVSNCVTVDQP